MNYVLLLILFNEYRLCRLYQGGREMDKIEDLKEQRKKLEERIRHLERDLKTPRSQDPDDDAVDAKNRDILYSLYQVEKKNLLRLDSEIRQSAL